MASINGDPAKRREIRAAEWVADMLGMPAALIDAEGRIRYNRLAERLLESESGTTRPMLDRHLGVIAASLRDEGLDALRARRRRVRSRSRRFVLDIQPAPPGLPLVALVRLHASRATLMKSELRERFGLTAREAEVARRIASGMPTKAVAASLGVSPHTVRRHTESLFRKVGVTSRTGLAARLYALGSTDNDGEPSVPRV